MRTSIAAVITVVAAFGAIGRVSADTAYCTASSDISDASQLSVCTYSSGNDTHGNSYSGYLCPLAQTMCTYSATANKYQCPYGSSHSCLPTGNGNFYCSNLDCATTASGVDTGVNNGSEPTSTGAVDSSGQCLGVIRIFPGRMANCRKNGLQTAWQNCCDSNASMNDTMTGASSDTKEQKSELEKNLSTIVPFYPQCKTAETQTAYQVASGYCHYIGENCDKKLPLVGCVQKSKSYCCYTSMMSRLIQEAAHDQLPSLSWGSASNPTCDGLTTAQFQSLDFSKIDFSSYYTELQHSTQSQIQNMVDTSVVPTNH